MQISKAIEILEDILRYVKPGDPPDEHDAVKLGIEALKLVESLQDLPNRRDSFKLPGQTEGG